MTFRRVMLVVLPLLAAILVFMGLRLLYLNWEASLTMGEPMPGGGTPDMPVGVEEMTTVERIGHEVSTDVNLVRKDITGRIEMRFLADRIEHKTKETADIERPRIQFFTKGDEIITLLADRASAVTKGTLSNVADIQSGRLWGNVILAHDRGTPDDLADDILVALDDVTFENEAYELATDGVVIMVGPEMSLTARRMRMALDRKTRRINTMTFFEDVFITMETGNRMRLSVMGAPPDLAPAAPPTGAAAATPARAAGTPPRDGPAPAAVTEVGELWRIDIAGDVDARQVDQRLRCEQVSLYNRAGRTGGTTVPKARATAPGVAPAAAAETAAGTPGEAPKPPEAESPADVPLPLVVMADGPLMITPVTEKERSALGDEQHQFTAVGEPAIVDDAQTHIVGAEIRYNTRTGAGSVIGKDAPILLEQPGRLRLTGGRLDFNRIQATAGVQGEGELHARAQTASLMGGAPAADPKPGAKPEEPGTLDASWARSMRLDFYRLPTDEKSGMGEIKHAAFHGKAVVKQQEGVLKGDDLLIDFLPAEAERGQAVQRLVGHGEVYLKNAQGLGSAVAAEPPKDPTRTTVGDISCQDLDVRFIRDAAGATQPKHMEASGSVAINDPQGKIRAQKLTVDFAPTEKGRMDAQFLEATGDVLIDRADLRAEGQHIIRDLATGNFLLEGKPARASQGESRIVGPRIEFSKAEGVATVRGAGELEMPATTDLRGRARAKPEPMLVSWQKSMRFEDTKNFAQFEGAVQAVTGGSRLDAEHLRLCFADRPKPAAEAPAAPTPAKADPLGGGMGDVFGRKGLVWVLAEKNVAAVEQQLAEDGSLRHRMEILGDNLTYLEENRKAYVRGPGRLRILARERLKPGEEGPPGLGPEVAASTSAWKDAVAPGYSRTAIGWTDSMAYESTSDRAYFKGKVDAVHTGRGAPGAVEVASRRGPATTRITSQDLQVVFSEKSAEVGGTPPAAAAAEPGTTREERMNVAKLVAGGNVRLWVDTWRGSSERVIYQRDPEMIRLYRGADDWARLWQENEASQQFDEIAARTITYIPSTGRIDVIEQQVMTASPKPKPVVKPKPKLMPAPVR